MVKAKTRNSGVSLGLECRNDELSEIQILHRKKQLEDIYMLQTAIQNSAPLDLGLSTAQVNGGTLHDVLNNDTSKTNQYADFLPRNGSVNGKNGISSKRKSNKNSQETNVASATSQAAQQPQQSLTQALRATRKTTGSLPPPKAQLMDDEPEIEVLQEMRNVNKSTQSVGSANVAANLAAQLGVSLPKPILPKPTSLIPRGGPTSSTLKPAAPSSMALKTNNVLLLNINVRPRNLAPVSTNSVKRKELDGKVKVILMKSPSEFVEWLLRQGLIRSQQLCSTHTTLNRQPTKLKLGMFSDPKVLTSSGGYVWIGECCGRKYISVYSGSLFGSTPIDKVPPTSVLKLVYHWSCQTSVSNVETWVKVDKSFISKIYHYLKCICSVILHDKIYDFGFEGTPVELGIVSLGTTTADGTRKAVKVEILGLYDRKHKSYRLFASTPEPASNSRERFLRILKPVKEVVHRNATLICDQSVDPSCLHSMGYSEVEVCYSSENESNPKTNSIIMFYLRKHVPKMFQAALSQLSEHQVQLTLDELSWREKFAGTSAECYDNIMENISYITYRELENPGVLPLLEFVSEFPHNNFRYKSQGSGKAATPSVPASVILAPTNAPLNVVPTQYNENKCLVMTNKVMMKNGVETKDTTQLVAPITIKNLTTISSSSFKHQPLTTLESPSNKSPSGGLQRSGEYRSLEPYFYGRIDGNPSLGQEFNDYVFKCHLCSETFEDNILFYAHLKYHFEGEVAVREKLDLMCPYCTTSFTSFNALNKHKIDVHLMNDLTQVWCRICAEKFQNESLLKTHMMRKHVEVELPYRCEVCHFATSFYFEIVNHFTRSHKGTPYVQCHFCLCVKILTPNGAASFSTRLFQHMQKHAQKLNCRSCVLVFYSKYLLNEHKKEHLSCANVNGVTRYESPTGYRILQFKPNIRSMPMGPSSSPSTVLHTKNQAALSVTQIDLSKLTVSLGTGETEYQCLECSQPLGEKMHYNQYRKCSRCVYHTCCQNMIMKHTQIFHPGAKKTLTYFIGRPIVMPEPIKCQCGFETRSGHHMAKHLSSCKKKVAHVTSSLPPPPMSSSMAPIVVLDEDEGEAAPISDRGAPLSISPSLSNEGSGPQPISMEEEEEPMEVEVDMEHMNFGVVEEEEEEEGDGGENDEFSEMPMLPLSVEIEED